MINVENVFTKTISITSGKGGVGKSTLVSNLGLYLASQGSRVLLLDGDLGMGNLDIMFNKRSLKTLSHVMQGEATLQEVIQPINENLHLVPGGSGVYELQSLNLFAKKSLLDQVSQLDGHYDYMLIDTAPGIADNVLYLNSSAQEIMVVLTPDPASLADTYALIKVLNQKQKENRFSVVCNFVRNEYEALKVYKRLCDVAEQFINVHLSYKGYVPFDRDLQQATKCQQLVLQSQPSSESSYAIQQLAEKLNYFNDMSQVKGGMQFFWQQLVGVA